MKMTSNTQMKTTSKMMMTIKMRQLKIWRWPQNFKQIKKWRIRNEDVLKKIIETVCMHHNPSIISQNPKINVQRCYDCVWPMEAWLWHNNTKDTRIENVKAVIIIVNIGIKQEEERCLVPHLIIICECVCACVSANVRQTWK